MRGKVRHFHERGYGFISCPDSENVFFTSAMFRHACRSRPLAMWSNFPYRATAKADRARRAFTGSISPPIHAVPSVLPWAFIRLAYRP